MGEANVVVENISTDTRQRVASSLFFALKGEHFDAHNYLDKAVAQGANALVVERADTQISVPQLIVKDTRIALGELAKWVKQQVNPRTLAMTGSSGKTTVKEMTASILQSAVGVEQVLFTQGNFNNDIGVPLTLLRLTEQHQFAVIELGANHQGEIAYTTGLVQPNVALVNNVAAAHLEGFLAVLKAWQQPKVKFIVVYSRMVWRLSIKSMIIAVRGRRILVLTGYNISLIKITQPIFMPIMLYFMKRDRLLIYVHHKGKPRFISLIWGNIMSKML